MARSLLFLIAAVSAFAASSAFASRTSAQAPASSQPPPSNVVAAGSFIAAIKDASTSIIRGEPRCGEDTNLTGALVMETPERAGFPFNATTFASPTGTFTTVTTTGGESETVIQEVAKTLNDRADDYVKKLLRNCSL